MLNMSEWSKVQSTLQSATGTGLVQEILIVWIFPAELMKVELLLEIINDPIPTFLHQVELKHYLAVTNC